MYKIQLNDNRRVLKLLSIDSYLYIVGISVKFLFKQVAVTTELIIIIIIITVILIIVRDDRDVLNNNNIYSNKYRIIIIYYGTFN